VEDLPFDLDTTSVGLMATKSDRGIVSSIMDEMLQYKNEDGIILVLYILYL
jgi:hypothetical protein